MMVYRPEVMLHGSLPAILYHVGICWAAIVAISGASIGYLIRPLGWAARAWLAVAAAALFFPSLAADLAGLALILPFLFWQWQRGRAALVAAPRDPAERAAG